MVMVFAIRGFVRALWRVVKLLGRVFAHGLTLLMRGV